MTISKAVRDRIAAMSLAEKVGQVFIFTRLNEAQAHNDLRLFPGGYIFIYSDALSVARQTQDLQTETRTPLFIAADFERGIGGTVNGASEVVTAMALGATGSEDAAYDAARIIASECLAMGVNFDFAPVLDVNSNPANPVINVRSFGGTPDLVARLGVAFIRGLQENGVAACGKHFPGHGNTNIDSHSQLGSVSGSMDELAKLELHPFRAAINAGVDAIMSAHLMVPTVEPDPVPATLSRRVLTGLLRETMGFQGVIVTDALDMGAIAKNFPPEASIPMAVNAGCDQLIMPNENELVVDILTAAVKRGEVAEDRLDDAVARILSLKEKRGIFDGSPADPATFYMALKTRKNQDRIQQIAEDSITCVHNSGAVPIRKTQKVLALWAHNGLADRGFYLEPPSFIDHLKADGYAVTKLAVPSATGTPENWTAETLEKLPDYDVIVLATYIGIHLSSGTIALPEPVLDAVNRIATAENAPPMVLASFGSPYAVSAIPGASAAFCAFSHTQPSQKAMARALRGEIEATGKLPLPLS